jgi:formate dehydrogenase gamma subunit
MRDNYQRFSTARIVEHALQIVTFSVLVATGLSQRFYSFDLSLWFILKLGGIDNVRFIHRYTGLIFSIAAIAHITTAMYGVVVQKWQPSMVITRDDFWNATHNIRYYLGIENHPAVGGRYSYTQKFEYWGILMGGILMIATGLVLWHPVLITRFMTGEVIPLAKVLHSNEALVVFLIIAGWHVYNAIFSPEVFPLNLSIFTGSITRERMVHEHIGELAKYENSSPEEIRAKMQKLATLGEGHDDNECIEK